MLEWLWLWILAPVVVLLSLWLLWRNDPIPTLTVDSYKDGQKMLTVDNHYIYVPRKSPSSGARVQCYDPATMAYFGFVPALKEAEVQERVQLARAAQQQWAKSSFSQRRFLLRILQKFIVQNQEAICRVSSKDSGKPMVDAGFGEIFTTCEKISWLISEGEKWLKPEYRSVGRMMLHKVARVEYHPLGVLAAIVPWNYPFHNIFNPVLSAVFSGNAIIIKVSEHTSWSADYYCRIIKGALRLAGAPPDLVSIITGFAETGQALVTSGVDQITFVGSTEVGRKVMAAASERLTPVTLELGGKDAFIICADADLDHVVPTALRAAYQCSGQNCIAAERFFVQAAIVNDFLARVLDTVAKMRVGPLSEEVQDMGAIVMPFHCDRLQALVDDAVSKGACLHTGGHTLEESGGQFYAPTVLSKVDRSMRILQEEVFGPIMTVISFSSEEEVVAMANDSSFGLGCSVFSSDKERARRIAAGVKSGMASINDFGSNYLSQSLPFGGVKDSGFGRFAGVEGLRACCNIKAVQEDRFPWLKTYIPKPLQYPVAAEAWEFQSSVVRFFYGATVRDRALGLAKLVHHSLLKNKAKRN